MLLNEKMNIERKNLKRFRAVLHQIDTEGLANKNWNNSKNTLSAIIGYAHFVHSVNPVKGKEFLSKIENIKKKYPEQIPVKTFKKAITENVEISEVSQEEVKSQDPVKKKWWKLF